MIEFLDSKVFDRIRLLNGKTISGGDLAEIFQTTDVAIRGAVKRLRLQHCPIAGIDSDGGYRLATKPEHLNETIEKFQSLIESHAAIIASIKETQRRMVEEGRLL